MTSLTLDITPSPRLLEVLGDIPLATWQCIAELVDNSFDDLLTAKQRSPDRPLTVDITFEDRSPSEAYLVISDNGSGMNLETLEMSLRAGHSSKNRYGTLGLFGMGFNIATARLGSSTTVATTQLGSSELFTVRIDFGELQKRESFKVPVEIGRAAADQSGTTVRIRLKKNAAEELRRPSTQASLRRQLGSVYSYLLRNSVPGISRKNLSAPINAVIRLDGKVLDPILPCIWADTRSVISSGVSVSAVQYIDRTLTDATACLHCGYWDKKNGPDVCEECGSRNLQLRARRIWGWIGIQRYIDSSHFGVDFYRYGRKILSHDRSLFSYTDPDTLQSEVEYPIEMPANRGRIVGEIHLDHVPVTYQKNAFDTQSREWQVAIETIRGDGPLKPRSSQRANQSPLAVLFSAFRRNDPGLRYLTPGDGKRALHEKAKEWATYFEKGIARYQEDSEWYDAAERHERARRGDEELAIGDRQTIPERESQSDIDAILEPIRPVNPLPVRPATAQAVAPVTINDIVERAKLSGQRRQELSGEFALSGDLGSWNLSVWTVKQNLRNGESNETLPSLAVVTGRSIEIIVNEEHLTFTEFGRDVRDVALIHASEMIKAMSRTSVPVATIYTALVLLISDLKITDNAIDERIQRTFANIREMMQQVIIDDPDTYWNVLSASDKANVETAAAIQLSTIPFEDVIEDGRYVLFLAPTALRRLIEARPVDFFEGKVFKPGIANRPEEAREWVINRILRSMATLDDFARDHLSRQKYDRAIALINIDYLDEVTVKEVIE